MNLLLSNIHDFLVTVLEVQSYQLLIWNEEARQFVAIQSHPMHLVPVPLDSASYQVISNLLDKNQWALDLRIANVAASEDELELRQSLNAVAEKMVFPLVRNNRLQGLLLVGEKKDGFQNRDLRTISWLGQLFVQLREDILETRKLELVGFMSRGIAHDLQSHITPVMTFLQMAQEQRGDPSLFRDLLPHALLSIQSIQLQIQGAVRFGETHTPIIQPIRLAPVAERAVNLASTRLNRKSIAVEILCSEELIAHADEVMILRLFGNLLANSIEASPPHSTIQIDISRVFELDERRECVGIRIRDEGRGMNPEKLQHVLRLASLFSDRAPADETGLGLAICRRIVQLHKGEFQISSEAGRGTTVTVRLPG